MIASCRVSSGMTERPIRGRMRYPPARSGPYQLNGLVADAERRTRSAPRPYVGVRVLLTHPRQFGIDPPPRMPDARADLVEAWLPAQTAIAGIECRPSRRRDGIFPKERSHADTESAGPSDRAVPPRQSAGCPHLVQAERHAAAQHRHRVSAGRWG